MRRNPGITTIILIALLAGMIATVLALTDTGTELEEDIGLATWFRLRGPRRPPNDIVIVNLDRVSASHLHLPNRPDRWPRSIYAKLVEALSRSGVSAIVFDMIFAEPRAGDKAFAHAIKQAGNVILFEYLKGRRIVMRDKPAPKAVNLSIERIVQPLPSLAGPALALAPFPLPKVPVRLNRFWTFKTGAGDLPTLPVTALGLIALPVYDDLVRLLVAIEPGATASLPSSQEEIIRSRQLVETICKLRELFTQHPDLTTRLLKGLEEPTWGISQGEKRILKAFIKSCQPDDSRYLNLYGPPGTITTISCYPLLEQGIREDLPQLKGKTVFIGVARHNCIDQKDGFYTVFTRADGLDISGVEIAATAFANLLEDMPVRPLPLPTQVFIFFVWGAAVAFISAYLPPAISAVMLTGTGLSYLILGGYQFGLAGTWYPMVIPLFFQLPLTYLVIMAWRYHRLSKQRENITKAFGYYLPTDMIDDLARDLSRLKSNPRSIYGICLITDAENYTSISERIEPEDLNLLMNQYYELIFRPVRDHGGHVSDVTGDSMLAIWTDTGPSPAPRSSACRAALAISAAVQRFNQLYPDSPLPTRIGLHSGHLALGNLGALNHYEYTPIGDIVNTTSRIEQLNKHLGTRLLASEEIVRGTEDLLVRRLGKFLLFGKSLPIVIYEIISPLRKASPAQRRLCITFSQALDAFQRRQWDTAQGLFEDCIHLMGEDGPSRFYLRLCEHYRKNVPEDDWHGLIILGEK